MRHSTFAWPCGQRGFPVIATVMISTILTSCGAGDMVTPPARPVLTLTVTPDETAVLVGGSVQLNATVTDENNNPVSGHVVSWTTADSVTATVGQTTGIVTAVAAGTALITATSSTLTATATIAVVASAAFSADVLPIFTANCAVSGCHVSPAPPQNLELSAGVAYTNLVNVPSEQSPLDRIEPGDPQASYLVHKLRGTQNDVGGSGLQMPRGTSPLAPALINTIIAWVRDGASNN